MWNNLLFYFYLFIIGRILPLILVRVRFFEVSHGNLLVKIYQSDLLVYCCIALRTLKGQVELVALYILVIPPHLSGRKIRVSKCVSPLVIPSSPQAFCQMHCMFHLHLVWVNFTSEILALMKSRGILLLT